MKIDELKKLESDFQVASVNGKIVQVDLPKEASNGTKSQLFYLEDGTGQMKMKIKDESLFIDNNDWGDIEVTIFGTPNAKKVPEGLKYLPKYEMITVTAGARFLLVTKDKKKEEKKEEVSEPQNTQPPYWRKTEYGIQGPNDHLIIQEYHERLHILNVLKMENDKNGSPFTLEVLFPMVTSIKIEADRSKRPILGIDIGPTTVADVHKKKFDSYEKPHPNPEPNKPPVKEQKEEKKEGEIISRTSEIKVAIKSMKAKGVHLLTEPGYKGDGTIYDALMDDETRPRLIKWAIKKMNSAKKLKPADDILVKNLIAIVNGFRPGTKTLVIQECLMLDAWELDETKKGRNFDYDMPADEYNEMSDQIDKIISDMGKSDILEAAEAYLK